MRARPLLRTTVLAAVGLCVFSATSVAQQRSPDEEDARIVRLLQRATFGARPEDVQRARVLGLEIWLDGQLHPETIENPVLSDIERRFPGALQEPAVLLDRFPPRQLQRDARRLQRGDSLSEEERQHLRREAAARNPVRILQELEGARLLRVVRSERQLEEVMTAFWFDHFNVFFNKGAVRWLLPDYENKAIRPYVFGRFEDLLVATAGHPAMLFYLDNWRSAAVDTAAIRVALRDQLGRVNRGRGGARVGGRGRPPGVTPPPQGGRGIRMGRTAMGDFDPDGPLPEDLLARLPGLNENYARELLELHTLGVDGGYSQRDVIEVARAFTGWSLGPLQGDGGQAGLRRLLGTRGGDGVPADPYEFWFRSEFHDRGPKVVLGEELAAGRGLNDGLDVLHMLATHPSTASHIARQLATRFVSDDPPASLVNRLATVFLETDGDLREVTRSLFTSPELYETGRLSMRSRSPFLLVAGALRATRARFRNPAPLVQALRTLGEAPYLAEPPTGYPEEAASWSSSGGLLSWADFALRLPSGGIPGVTPDGDALFRDARRAGGDRLEGLVRVLIPGADPDEVLPDLRAALEAEGVRLGDPGTGAKVVGLILASPAFRQH